MLTASMSRKGGGVFDVVRMLAQALHAPPEMAVEVCGLDDRKGADDVTAWGSVPAHAHAVTAGPRAWGYAKGLLPAVAAAEPDLVHMHGLWMYPSLAGLLWARRTGRPTVVSPHGMLDPWALNRSRGKKRLIGLLYEWANLRRAGCIHALCEAEAQSIRALGLHNPICVIPNGITLPDGAPPAPPAWAAPLPADARVLLYLGRLHPKKNIRPLIQAWRAARRPPWHLAIAGWSQEGYGEELREAAHGDPTIHFTGAVFGADKDATFARADGFILPSLSEGLPMAVLEAWAHRLPVLMTPACNIPEGFAAGAAMRVGTDADALADSLSTFLTMSDDARRAMGDRGRRLVMDRFTWPKVAAEMAAVYRWLAAAGPRPGCVQVLP
ncbi:MAG TPA: glycosyltransferase [Magnetospirillum sp.]|nr:glycosyltransferase [Magnetospirillum sp.]